MKKLLFIAFIFLLFACKKQRTKVSEITKPAPATLVKNTTLSLNIPNISAADFAKAVDWSVSGTTLYTQNGVEHLIISPSLFYDEPLIPAIHLIKKNDAWVYIANYAEAAMGAGRDSELFDDAGTIVFADHGLELRQGTWPFGNIMMAKTNGEKLSWSTISSDRSFYHSVSTGDLNNDGLKDIIGLHMGTKGNFYDNLHPYIQSAGGNFTLNRNLISYASWPGLRGAGAVLVVNVLGDSKPEIIMADYGPDPRFPRIRYSFAIFGFSSQTGKYEFVKSPGVFGFATRNLGVSSLKATDFDKDGDLDLALAYESDQLNGIELWTNDGNGDYSFNNQRIEYNFSDLQFREFEMADVDGDGWVDIVFNPFNGKLFKTFNNGPEVLLHNLIWKNSNGVFKKLDKEQRLSFNKDPFYLKAFVINNKLRFVGIRGNQDRTFNITEINPVFD
jgi:hypothetical protein